MRLPILALLYLLLAMAVPCGACAQEDTLGGEMPLAEDYVIASVCVASPGSDIYSSLGHACLRLQCPEHGLDFIYSNEAEDVAHNVLAFFAGRLKMRTVAVPAQEYLNQYRAEGRSVVEYRLNLPIQVKQRLWRQMDCRLEYSPIPYDYMKHGCAVSVLEWLEEAIGSDSLEYAPWLEKYTTSTRKDLAGNAVQDPWLHFFLPTFIAGEGDDVNVPLPAKLVVPADMLEVLCEAKAFGKKLIGEEPVVLLAQTSQITYTCITPFIVALIMLIAILVNLKFHLAAIDYMVVAIGSIVGLFVAYLLWMSDLPCTGWNWLVIPFNPFLLLCYKWRRWWALPYALICTFWAIGMWLWPHEIVDDAHILLVLAMVVSNVEYRYRSIKS